MCSLECQISIFIWQDQKLSYLLALTPRCWVFTLKVCGPAFTSATVILTKLKFRAKSQNPRMDSTKGSRMANDSIWVWLDGLISTNCIKCVWGEIITMMRRVHLLCWDRGLLRIGPLLNQSPVIVARCSRWSKYIRLRGKELFWLTR